MSDPRKSPPPNQEAEPGGRHQPTAPDRGGMASSQGLSGAQGSGGGAERGVQQPPHRAVNGPPSGPANPAADQPQRHREAADDPAAGDDRAT